MEGLLKKYYALLVLLLVVPIVAVLVQYGFYYSILEQKSRNLAVERMLGAEQKLAAWLDARRQNIRLASLAASKYPNDALALCAGLQTILQSDPYFRSLYYVTRENKMVNATDFVPPPTLDFRLRPWYVKAAEKGGLVHIGEHYVGGYGIYSDISMRKENERKIIRMSHYDQLTNVYNRAYFDHVFAELTAHGPWPVSLIMGDTNGLKVVNDAFGHGMGDEILKRTARVLALEARPQDTVARLGGDEFAMLLPGVDENEAMAICARIRERCQAGSDTTIHLSLALGASTAHDRQRKEVLFTAAEERMYHQKLLEGKSIRNSLIASLRQALQEKTHETTEHSMRMTDLSLRLAAKLELSPSMRDDIEVFASIHDLGKIAIPEQILEKCGPLTAEKWSIMQKHSEIGFRIASTSPELSHIAECILHHHERWDGTGYPQGLRGEAICLRSRVVAVVDAYDAMTSDRPYRRALGRELALAEIEKGRGRQFDPRVADAFLALMHSSAEYEPTGQGED